MATVLIRCVLFLILSLYVFGDDIEMEVHSGRVLKMLREMVNQTAAESLNLPANATSIRENITDTFSCENRTYGYYADVDNDCQIFHICYPSQMPSGRNITYRWSFICPLETVFNQEVLVCTRAIDSIPCEESPNYYDLNMEIGKVVEPEANKEETVGNKEEIEANKEEIETNKKETEQVPVKKEIRKPNRRKQNIIMEALMKEAEEEMEVMEAIEELNGEKAEESAIIEFNGELPGEQVPEPKEVPEVVNVQVVDTEEVKPMAVEEVDENSRLGTERNLRRRGRKINRGSMKYRGNA